MNDREIVEWVNAVEPGQERTFREAAHTVLYAIASSTSLQPQMIMKGGILMAIRYETGRFTKDIDFSTTAHYRDFQAGQAEFLSALDAAIQKTVNVLGYQLDCRRQSTKLEPKRDGGNFQTLHISIGYAYIGSSEHRKLAALQAPKTVQVDYSFNEQIHDMDLLSVENGDIALRVYGELTQVAEKLRATLQQAERNRARGQDIYDLFHLFTKYPITDEERKAALLETLKEKALSRGIVAEKSSMANPEIKKRSASRYANLKDTVERELPDFEEAYACVQRFYESLPW